MTFSESSRHESFMRRALLLARQAWGATHPNPMVGALVVEKGDVVAEGFHARAGEPHAEVKALRALGRRPAEGATLYVTLEPCSTQGRTGPCTQALLEAGLKRVVVGAVDPNPAHAGRGIALLRAAGVEVTSEVLADECADLNLIFNHWIVVQRPLLAAKMATTLDGKIATRSGDSKWITGEAAREDVMRWRRLFPAIAVGAGTVLADDPRLTARFDGGETCPWRIIVDGGLRTIEGTRLPGLYTDKHRERTIVVTTEVEEARVRRLEEAGVRVWKLPALNGRVRAKEFSQRCAEERIVGVLFEGGADLLGRFFTERAFDYLFAYRGPVLFADDQAKSAVRGGETETVSQAIRLEAVQTASFSGGDQLLRGRVVYPKNELG